MHHLFNLSRRHLLSSAAALGVLGIGDALGVTAALAQTTAPAPLARRARPTGLPARGEYVIRNAYVMTMDAQLGDIAGGDVHVRNGAIVAVGKKLNAPASAERIEGSDFICLPGLVETHWHLWNTLLRSMANDKPELGYFPSTTALGKVFLPTDMYQGTRLAAAEAINGGITFVHDWCHNVRSPAFAEENLQALKESGIRARYSQGYPQGLPPAESDDLALLERMHKEWDKHSNEGLLTLGHAWRGSRSLGNPRPPAVFRAEIDTSRRLGIPISVHAGMIRGRNDNDIQILADAGLLGKDLQVIHATHVTKAEIEALATSGTSVSLSPYTELRTGFGIPPTGELLAAKIPIGLSVDTTELSGNADMFAIMKSIQNVENGVKEKEFELLPRRVIELATIEGARSMGMDARIGSLKPGKRADLILVSTTDINMGPFTDPAHLIVEAAQPSNVDLVMVDGRILKRRKQLTAVNVKAVVAEANGALAGVRKRAGWW
jgi:5-methylthioadenosine/S-adenosylhomocysteine deaminase